LLLLAQAWPEAIEAILRVAPELAAEGRFSVLHRWLVALPELSLAGNAWLSYWLASALSGVDSSRALACLETAYEGFSRSSEAAGRYLAFADAIQLTWMTGCDLTPIDGWLARFDELDAQRIAIPSIAIEARVLTSLLMGAYLRKFGDPRVSAWLERAREILDDVPGPVPRAALFASLGWHYYYGLGPYHVWLRELNALLEAERPDAPPLYYLYLWVSMAFGRFYAGEFNDALRAADRGLALADATGVHVADGQLAGVRAKAALCLGDRDAADAALERMATALAARPDGYTKSFEAGVRAWRQLLDPGGGPEAVELAREAVRAADRAGAAYPRGACRYVLAHALFETGEDEEGLACLEESRIRWSSGEHEHQAFQSELTKAWLGLRRGERDAALDALRRALARGERMGYGAPIASRPAFLYPLLQCALEERIHAEYAQRLILQARLVPASPADLPSAWPVPVRIWALGGFQVALFGASLDPGPLQRNRPLELLKVMIALGGSDVAQERLAGAVWPDGSGDRAIAALHTTLHRLRKLLRREDAILLKDGRVSLNDRVVWVDVWGAEALLERLERALADEHADPAVLRELERRLVGLYKGSFLEFEAERAWALRLRDGLHERAVGAYVAIGQRWQEAGDSERALESFKSALRLDPLSEKLHRNIMRIHADNGEFAEALAVYERCKKTLSLNFGVPPGLATAGLYEAIRKGLAEP
jgi:DNA-binding SARP family transcriptional activator